MEGAGLGWLYPGMHIWDAEAAAAQGCWQTSKGQLSQECDTCPFSLGKQGWICRAVPLGCCSGAAGLV